MTFRKSELERIEKVFITKRSIKKRKKTSVAGKILQKN